MRVTREIKINELSFPKLISFLNRLFKDLPYLLSWSEEKNDACNSFLS
jgi:hypothetical protein